MRGFTQGAGRARAAEPARAALMARGEALLHSEPNFARFLKAMVEAMGEGDLVGADAGRIEALLRLSYGELDRPRGGAHRVVVQAGALAAGGDALDIYSDDMPFVVDSVLAALHAEGRAPLLAAHAVLTLDRQSRRLVDQPMADTERVSVLHLHLPPADEAARASLRETLEGTLQAVRASTSDWRAMLKRLADAAENLGNEGPLSANATEAMRLLGWLAEDNFLFLGMRDYRLASAGSDLEPLPDGLGILADPAVLFLRQDGRMVEMTDQHRAFLIEDGALLVGKANRRAEVHRRAHMDYIGIKTYAGGDIVGELRVVGLFTSAAQQARPEDIPWLRAKREAALEIADSGRDRQATRRLRQALDGLPRDELLQAGAEQLAEMAHVVAGLADRPRLRLLSRPDPFGNFVSVLLYVPRERYSAALENRVGERLAALHEGRLSAAAPHFGDPGLVRAHFIIGRDGGAPPQPDLAALEAEIGVQLMSHGERLALEAGDAAPIAGFEEVFDAAYQAGHSIAQALADIRLCQGIDAETGRAIRFDTLPGGRLGVTLAVRGGPVPLGELVPALGSFGFSVIGERCHALGLAAGPLSLHEMTMEPGRAMGVDLDAQADALERALQAIWRGRAEVDGLNALTLLAGLDWRDVGLLRALCRYQCQSGAARELAGLAETLARHPDAAAALVALFRTQHDPRPRGDRDERVRAARRALDMALQRALSLPEDRDIRQLAGLIERVERTNFFRTGADGEQRAALALKLAGAAEGDAVMSEIFVSGPTVEGVLLRDGPVARGVIRWSERPREVRREALARLRRQRQENAAIVPVAASGAFVPRARAHVAGQPFGAAAYRTFVSALLDITDTVESGRVSGPAQVLRRDGDDAYLAAAGEDGTAGFANLAHQVATERGFWLADAFAPGRSGAYDRRASGVLAAGLRESLHRHLLSAGRDPESGPIRLLVVGAPEDEAVAGLLAQPGLRLVGAIDEEHILLDPLPVPEKALPELKRLIDFPRAGWGGYSRVALSRGGDVFGRGQQSVTLSTEARRWLGLGTHTLTPEELIRALLSAEVDVLLFSGEGTFVRAAKETDGDAADRRRDTIRVTAETLRARAAIEATPDAFTPRARIAYALKGGQIASPAMDMSAGIGSDDMEANIRIALAPLLATGRLDAMHHSVLIERMQADVTALSARRSRQEALALAVTEAGGAGELPDQLGLIEELERAGLVTRDRQGIAPTPVLRARAETGKGLTRPELALVMAGAKTMLRARLAGASRLGEPYLLREAMGYFPARLGDEHPEAISDHRLRPQIVASMLANGMIERGGLCFAHQLDQSTSTEPMLMALAYVLARDAFRVDEMTRLVELQESGLPQAAQMALYRRIQHLLQRTTLWMLRNAPLDRPLGDLVQHFTDGLAEVRSLLPTLVTGTLMAASAQRSAALKALGAPRDLARRVAELPDLALGADAVLLAGQTRSRIGDAALALFGLADIFYITDLLSPEQAMDGEATEQLAMDRAAANLRRALRDLARNVLASEGASMPERLTNWQAANAGALARTKEAVTTLTQGRLTLARLSLAAGLLSDLAHAG